MMQKSTGRNVILILTLMWLTGCSGIPVKVDVDCAWFDDQSFSEETKAWLLREPWPEYVREDFDKVADNNDLYKRYCE